MTGTSNTIHSTFRQQLHSLADLNLGKSSGGYTGENTLRTKRFFGTVVFAYVFSKKKIQSIWHKRLRVSKPQWRSSCSVFAKENRALRLLCQNKAFVMNKLKTKLSKTSITRQSILGQLLGSSRPNWRKFEWWMFGGKQCTTISQSKPYILYGMKTWD